MISQNEQEKIREILNLSQNPLFFFDNDADGLCSFLILQRCLDRGKGIPIKSYPELASQYIRKVDELNADLIIILDKADVSEEFINEAEQRNIPILWIDHHKSSTNPEVIKRTDYYNSFPSAEPVTYLAQSIFKRKEDLWLAMVGCIADVYTPHFHSDFEEMYPELYNKEMTAFEALHATEVGKFALMLNFGLMNTITNVVKLIKFLIRSSGPYDLLEENFYTREFHKRYNELYGELGKQVEKAHETQDIVPGVRYFSYASKTSMSAILASRLYFELPKKTILVGYKRPEKINLSIRGSNALKLTKYLVENLEGATGGGHPEATGAMVPTTQEEKFLELLKSYNHNT